MSPAESSGGDTRGVTLVSHKERGRQPEETVGEDIINYFVTSVAESKGTFRCGKLEAAPSFQPFVSAILILAPW